ncbi:MAG TPA: hypothetical protein VK013_14045 [Myxococcaceae bacterium]|nr:hypothetical protein [Myxococcaceae bacterium]
MSQNDVETQADRWRQALRRAAREALDLAGIQGLCVEGQVELAVSAMRELPADDGLAPATAEAIREAQIQGLLQRGCLD